MYSHTFHLGTSGALLVVLAAVIAAMGLWYLSIRTGRAQLKIIALFLGGFPIVGFGAQIAASYFDWGAPDDEFKSSVTGPAHNSPPVTNEMRFYINHAEMPHRMELTPKPSFGETPAGPVTLELVIVTAKGDTVSKGRATLAPGPSTWATAHLNFTPPLEGEYLLKLTIPTPAGQVDVKISEEKK